MDMETGISRRLKMSGMILFLTGLITGFLIMTMQNPRMALAAHLEGIMNGIFLVITGIIWNELYLSGSLKKILFWTLIYGTFTNWSFTLLAAILGTSKMTPIAGEGFSSTQFHENLITAGLALVGLTMAFSLVIIVYGLRGKASG